MKHKDFIINYLDHTLHHALHERRIHIGSDTYRVSVEDGGKSGSFIHIRLMGHGEVDWQIVATPGFDQKTKIVPIDVWESGTQRLEGWEGFDIQWTGKVKYDVEIYLHALRSHMIEYILPTLFPKQTPMCKGTLSDIEGALSAASVDLWRLTVDDPETATVESEKAGMTPEREVVKNLYDQLQQVRDQLNDAIPYLTGTGGE
jgi:hypothetical protein|tara:strand:+ start:445 stop:1050 length:606 start_codon:yes stop_codon:yes gene_type:complete